MKLVTRPALGITLAEFEACSTHAYNLSAAHQEEQRQTQKWHAIHNIGTWPVISHAHRAEDKCNERCEYLTREP